jgi:hypothetical protein
MPIILGPTPVVTLHNKTKKKIPPKQEEKNTPTFVTEKSL